MEVWVVYTSSEDYSEDEFYRDLASLLMERSGARTVVSPSTRQKADTGSEWLYGKVEVKSGTCLSTQDNPPPNQIPGPLFIRQSGNTQP